MALPCTVLGWGIPHTIYSIILLTLSVTGLCIPIIDWLTLSPSTSQYSPQLTKCANVVLRSVTPRQPGWDIDFVKSPAPRLLYCSGYFAESEWKILYSMKTEPPLILVTRWSGWLIDWIWDEMWAELSELGCCDATLHHNLMFPPSLSLLPWTWAGETEEGFHQ